MKHVLACLFLIITLAPTGVRASEESEFSSYETSVKIAENIIGKVITSDLMPYLRTQGLLLGCEENKLLETVINKTPRTMATIEEHLIEATKEYSASEHAKKKGEINKYIIISHVNAWRDGVIWGNYENTVLQIKLNKEYCANMVAPAFAKIMKK